MLEAVDIREEADSSSTGTVIFGPNYLKSLTKHFIVGCGAMFQSIGYMTGTNEAVSATATVGMPGIINDFSSVMVDFEWDWGSYHVEESRLESEFNPMIDINPIEVRRYKVRGIIQVQAPFIKTSVSLID
ncbi:hypothetical protein ACFLTO_01580 [Chloroflexota bacterium]